MQYSWHRRDRQMIRLPLSSGRRRWWWHNQYPKQLCLEISLHEFKKVSKEVEEELEKEDSETTHNEENTYFCPGILDVLSDTSSGIFPLWNGLLLGDLKRYANDKENYSFPAKQNKGHKLPCWAMVWNSVTLNSEKTKATEARDICKTNVWLSTGEAQKTCNGS